MYYASSNNFSLVVALLVTIYDHCMKVVAMKELRKITKANYNFGTS